MGFFFIALILLIILYLVLWTRGMAGWIMLAVSFGAPKRQTIDVSDRKSPLAPELTYAAGTLEKLGFSRLGEVQVAVPGGQIVRSRLFVSSDNKVLADLAETAGNFVTFTTVFSDDAVLETGYPVGENIDTAAFRSHTITSDLENAYRHQIGQIGDFGRTHGAPRRIKNMQDYLAFDGMYRKRYISHKMRRQTWLGFWQIFLLAFGVLALLAAVVYWLGSDLSTIDPLIFVLFLLAGILTPAAILAFLIPYIGDRGSRRETKK